MWGAYQSSRRWKCHTPNLERKKITTIASMYMYVLFQFHTPYAFFSPSPNKYQRKKLFPEYVFNALEASGIRGMADNEA
jgi:hypothetical protein